MTNTVNDYLERLDAALAHVPYATAREIRAGIEEELRSLEPTAADERMRELGDPAAIAAAAAGSLQEGPAARGAGAPSWAAAPPPRSAGTASPIYVVLTGLAVAFGMWVVPVVGWFAGIVLMWTSVVWRRWEKILATTVPLGAVALLAVIGAIVNAVREQQRIAAYSSEVQLEFHAPSVDEHAVTNPFIPADYDLLWSAPLAVGILNVAIGVWLLAVAFRRGLEPVSPRRATVSGPGAGGRADAGGGSAFTAIAIAMLVVGVLGGLGSALLFARPITAAPLLLLAVAGLVMLVVRAISRR